MKLGDLAPFVTSFPPNHGTANEHQVLLLRLRLTVAMKVTWPIPPAGGLICRGSELTHPRERRDSSSAFARRLRARAHQTARCFYINPTWKRRKLRIAKPNVDLNNWVSLCIMSVLLMGFAAHNGSLINACTLRGTRWCRLFFFLGKSANLNVMMTTTAMITQSALSAFQRRPAVHPSLAA